MHSDIKRVKDGKDSVGLKSKYTLTSYDMRYGNMIWSYVFI